MTDFFERSPGRRRFWCWTATLVFAGTLGQVDRLRSAVQDTLEGKSMEDVLKVRSVIEKAIQEDPGNSELWVHLGMVHRKLDRLEDARSAFERAASLNPKNGNAHFMLGLIYEKTKQTDKAIAAWEACRRSAGDDKMREIAEKHIGLLKGQSTVP